MNTVVEWDVLGQTFAVPELTNAVAIADVSFLQILATASLIATKPSAPMSPCGRHIPT
jgi:hypothetical protein